jgi:putative serine protease PepD
MTGMNATQTPTHTPPRLSMRPSVRKAGAIAAVLVLGAGSGAAAGALLDNGSTTTVVERSSGTAAESNGDGALSVNDIYRDANQGVVEIKTTSTSDSSGGPFGVPGGQESESEGSGFVLDKDGHIVTNEHVVADADSIEVTFADGTKADAEVVGSDASSDVAVLHVDVAASELDPLEFSDSSNVEVGDEVVAIGSPYGYEESVTTGIVSALDRSITSPSNYTISGVLQTDAAINPGNSGGPLLDSGGRVIGMNAQIESSSNSNSGVGFAIPSDTVQRVADALIGGEQVEHAYLGVSLSDATARGAPDRGSPRQQGAEVASVRSGSPADEAGLEAGDVITAIEGETVSTADDATSAINAKSPGDQITVTITRSGERSTLDVTLGTRPST